MGKEDGSIMIFGHNGTAESYYNLNTCQGAVTFNQVYDDYFVIMMILEHEKNHNEETKKYANHDITSLSDHHFDVQWGAHMKYGRQSQEAYSFSKELLQGYLDDMAQELNEIKDKSSSTYLKKYTKYAERKAKFEKEFKPE